MSGNVSLGQRLAQGPKNIGTVVRDATPRKIAEGADKAVIRQGRNASRVAVAKGGGTAVAGAAAGLAAAFGGLKAAAQKLSIKPIADKAAKIGLATVGAVLTYRLAGGRKAIGAAAERIRTPRPAPHFDE